VARLLRRLDPGLAHLLEGIPYASSATVTLAYRRSDIAHALDGFGFVVPQTEGRPIIAGTFSSVKYPGRAPEGMALLRVFLGGAMNEGVLEGDDAALAATARSQLAELLGAGGEPLFTRVSRHVKAMPQYQVGHLARVDAIESATRRHRGLALAGGAYRGVGISDCVRSGEDAAERLLG
jgi:oxygen-dependent protoporphyrinogen oxidase